MDFLEIGDTCVDGVFAQPTRRRRGFAAGSDPPATVAMAPQTSSRQTCDWLVLDHNGHRKGPAGAICCGGLPRAASAGADDVATGRRSTGLHVGDPSYGRRSQVIEDFVSTAVEPAQSPVVHNVACAVIMLRFANPSYPPAFRLGQWPQLDRRLRPLHRVD